MEHLGKTVIELTSGIKGVAYCFTDSLRGMSQYGLQPKAKEGDDKLPDMIMVDLNLMEIVDDGLMNKVIKPDMTTVYNLGDKVKHKINKVQGVVNSRVFYLNGCVHLNVVGEKPSSDGGFIRIKEDTKMWDLEKAHKIDDLPTDTPRGGPMTTMKR